MSIMQSLLLLLALLSCCGIVLQAQAQQTGFYSIDCGSPLTHIYQDPVTTIQWTPDSGIMTEGLTETVTPPVAEPGDVFTSLRYFPGNHSKYCYPLSPVAAGYSYIVRASFWMGETPLYPTEVTGQVSFQLIIDSYVATKVEVALPQSYVVYQELYVTANASRMTACVARTAGSQGADPPFISGLELRPLSSSTYGGYLVQTSKYPLLMIGRSNFGVPSANPSILRYPDDDLDRIWYQKENFYSINTTLGVSTNDIYDQVPEKVVQDSFYNVSLVYTQVDQLSSHEFLHSVYFAEIDPSVDQAGLRVFDVEINGETLVTGLDVYARVGAFKAMEIVNVTKTKIGWINISFNAVIGSTHVPFIAGIEVSQFLDKPIPFGTYDVDVVAIQVFVSNLSTISSYKGDPCLPSEYKFPWLSCNDNTSIRIVAMNLSSYGLVGNIPTSINDISELTTIALNANNLQGEIPDLSALINLEYLDLSNNQLTGPIPISLATLPNLKTLYLQDNNLSGIVPQALLQKTNLEFKYTGNKNLCETNSSCVTKPPLSSSPLPIMPTSSSSSPTIGIIVGVVVGVVVLIMIAIFIILRHRNQRHMPVSSRNLALTPQNLPANPKARNPHVHVADTFTYKEIRLATNNFSDILGRGGFGPVYRGTLLDGRMVAIKVCSETTWEGEVEFMNEANLLSTVHHKNIVQLLGYCSEDLLELVYELMPRGSLHDALFGSHSITSPLSWIERLSIMADVAQGLDYLHRQCVKVIVHRDVKSSNILLGHNLEGKIGDLGISKDNVAATTRLMGTFGYLDPEYATSLQLTPMVDVFSFGVVLFEVITGKFSIIKGIEGQDVRLVDWVSSLVQSGNLDQLVDSRIKNDFDVNAMWEVIDIAINCTKFKSSERPHMVDVYACIQNAIQIESNSNNNPLQSSNSHSFSISSIGDPYFMPSTILTR